MQFGRVRYVIRVRAAAGCGDAFESAHGDFRRHGVCVPEPEVIPYPAALKRAFPDFVGEGQHGAAVARFFQFRAGNLHPVFAGRQKSEVFKRGILFQMRIELNHAFSCVGIFRFSVRRVPGSRKGGVVKIFAGTRYSASGLSGGVRSMLRCPSLRDVCLRNAPRNSSRNAPAPRRGKGGGAALLSGTCRLRGRGGTCGGSEGSGTELDVRPPEPSGGAPLVCSPGRRAGNGSCRNNGRGRAAFVCSPGLFGRGFPAERRSPGTGAAQGRVGASGRARYLHPSAHCRGRRMGVLVFTSVCFGSSKKTREGRSVGYFGKLGDCRELFGGKGASGRTRFRAGYGRGKLSARRPGPEFHPAFGLAGTSSCAGERRSRRYPSSSLSESRLCRLFQPCGLMSRR